MRIGWRGWQRGRRGEKAVAAWAPLARTEAVSMHGRLGGWAVVMGSGLVMMGAGGSCRSRRLWRWMVRLGRMAEWIWMATDRTMAQEMRWE